MKIVDRLSEAISISFQMNTYRMNLRNCHLCTKHYEQCGQTKFK